LRVAALTAGECTAVDTLTCGLTVQTDPRVVYDQTSAMFFFVVVDTASRIVLASAPGTDPFAVAGCVELTQGAFGLGQEFYQDSMACHREANPGWSVCWGG